MVMKKEKRNYPIQLPKRDKCLLHLSYHMQKTPIVQCPRALSEACSFGTPFLSASADCCSISGITTNPATKRTPKVQPNVKVAPLPSLLFSA